MRPDQLIALYATSHAQGKLYIITEYAGNGNLHDYIKKQKQRLPEDMIWKLFAQVPGRAWALRCGHHADIACCSQILLGLNHMHSRKILHRDIKTLNVFLDDGLNVKLGDMGVAKVCAWLSPPHGCSG